MATLRNPRNKQSPVYYANGAFSDSDPYRKVYMYEERYFPALAAAITAFTAVPHVSHTPDNIVTASAADLALINSSLSVRNPRGFLLTAVAVGSDGTCTAAIAGTDQFGIARTETMTLTVAMSTTPLPSLYAYQKITSLVVTNTFVVDSNHPTASLSFGYLGVGCKITVIDEIDSILSVTSAGVVVDVKSATNVAFYGDVAAGAGTKYSVYVGSSPAYTDTLIYKIAVPNLNDQPVTLQVVR